MSKYAIGVDFGTLSARALVVEIGTGREMGEAVFDYPHGVMTECLPDGTPLKPGWALQHPDDYELALMNIVPQAVGKAGVSREDVVGVGIDFTSCTLLAVDAYGEPLCRKYPGRAHAYPKLWKHHACQAQADKMTCIAQARCETWLTRYGGKVSSEWMMPKIWQMLDEDAEMYEETDKFVDAGDWLVWRMTGRLTRNSAMAGYKAFWNRREGYPNRAFFEACDARLANVVQTKLGAVVPNGSLAGGLTRDMAEKLGLMPFTAVAAANIDAHVSVPAAGMTEPGELLMIMGTSTCHILLGDKVCEVPGMCGAVEDGAIPGLIAYEAGQSCVGDHFRWFAENGVPAGYEEEAKAQGVTVQQHLTNLAARLKPGENGLLALDWWNGNRSVLVNADLTGLILGMTLETKPEEIYRALIEATAYGTRMIVDNFDSHGASVRKVYACGGIARKNPFLMQLYADVLRREIRVAKSAQSSALGAAIFGAVAAGKNRGGYETVNQAAKEMGGTLDIVYRPQPRNSAIYDTLYAEYRRLHDYFGRGGSGVMKRLKQISADQKQ